MEEKDYVYTTLVPHHLEPWRLEPLFWSNDDGWVHPNDREVSLFSFSEILYFGISGIAPINPPFGVKAMPLSDARTLMFECKAYLN